MKESVSISIFFYLLLFVQTAKSFVEKNPKNKLLVCSFFYFDNYKPIEGKKYEEMITTGGLN
jgi:hypothetical protein